MVKVPSDPAQITGHDAVYRVRLPGMPQQRSPRITRYVTTSGAVEVPGGHAPGRSGGGARPTWERQASAPPRRRTPVVWSGRSVPGDLGALGLLQAARDAGARPAADAAPHPAADAAPRPADPPPAAGFPDAASTQSAPRTQIWALTRATPQALPEPRTAAPAGDTPHALKDVDEDPAPAPRTGPPSALRPPGALDDTAELPPVRGARRPSPDTPPVRPRHPRARPEPRGPLAGSPNSRLLEGGRALGGSHEPYQPYQHRRPHPPYQRIEPYAGEPYATREPYDPVEPVEPVDLLDPVEPGEQGEPERRVSDGVRDAYYPGRRLELGVVLLPLRLFLGLFSAYAGMHKLCTPHYFDGLTHGSLATSLRAMHPWAPAAPLRDLALAHPVGAGLTVSFLQVVVGVLTVLGLWQRLAAGVGALMSVALLVITGWDTASGYHATDIICLAAWSPLVIAGAPVYSVDGRLCSEAWRTLGPRAALWELRRRVLRRGTLLAVVVIGLTFLTGALFGSAVRDAHRAGTPKPGDPPRNALPGSPLPDEPGTRRTSHEPRHTRPAHPPRSGTPSTPSSAPPGSGAPGQTAPGTPGAQQPTGTGSAPTGGTGAAPPPATGAGPTGPGSTSSSPESAGGASGGDSGSLVGGLFD